MRNKLLASVALSVSLTMTACGTIAPPVPNSATLEAQRQQSIVEAPQQTTVAVRPTNTVPPPTATPLPPTEAPTIAPTASVPSIPPTQVPVVSLTIEEEQIVIFIQEFGNPVKGQQIFNTTYEVNTATGLAEWKCATCHSVESDVAGVGPGLYSLSERAGGRIPGTPAELYVYHSITIPAQYIVSGYPENLMPIGYSDVLSQQDIYDVAAYVLSLNK